MANPILSVKWSTDRFHGFLKTFQEHYEQSTPLVLKKFALEVITRIIARTPVDTGRARYGWSGGMRELGYSVPVSPDSQPGDAEYEESMTPTDILIRFTNNVPYVIFLEYGWSKQAPLGMVRITMAEVRSWGGLPNVLAKNYSALWEGAGASRYVMQAQIMSQGLPMVRDSIGKPSKASIPMLNIQKTGELNNLLRRTRARHMSR